MKLNAEQPSIAKNQPSTHDDLIQDIANLPANIDFRHLSAFKKVYLERNYANAGIAASTTRKSMVRMMQNLERILESSLFIEEARGELTPTPFAERLFNDLRFLHSAQCRLRDYVNGIHETGRTLHVGCSPAVFRTLAFRSLFRELQTLRGVRLSYAPVNCEEAGRSLLSGQCDLFIGPWEGQAKRFSTVPAGKVRFRHYCRLPATGPEPMSFDRFQNYYIVQLDGVTTHVKDLPGFNQKWMNLSEKQWTRWLDYPKECPPNVLICAPDTSADSTHWQISETSWIGTAEVELNASFLRQHPYEFLPALSSKIKAHAVQS